jgi:hypothetical protein
MTDEDRARSAERLLNEPMLVEAVALVERDAIEKLLVAADDRALRECRDYVLAIRAVVGKLQIAVLKVQEAKRHRISVV